MPASAILSTATLKNTKKPVKQALLLETSKTLDDKIINFSIVKLKKAIIKVSKIKKAKKPINAKKTVKPLFLPNIKDYNFVSSIANILIKNAVEDAKKQAKPVFLHDSQEEKGYTFLKDDKDKNIGGYGTIPKVYGSAFRTSYADYEKIFSYLGKFKAKSYYENSGSNNSIGGNLSDDGKFLLIETETMEKGAKFVRYFSNPGLDIYSATLSAVPFGGMGGSEWEQFKLLMQLDKVMYKLKTSSS